MASLKHCIKGREYLILYKGDDDLLPFFHTVDENFEITGPLLDLIEKGWHSNDLVQMEDPEWIWRRDANAWGGAACSSGDGYGSQPRGPTDSGQGSTPHGGVNPHVPPLDAEAGP